MQIKSVKAIEILDSRGIPTIKTSVMLQNGFVGVASVPAGASIGTYESLELRDKDKRYSGKGVLKAINNINNEIAGALINKDANQKNIDDLLIKLDGTENKSRLGSNAILAVSLAVARAMANASSMPLYQYLNEIVKLEPKIPIPLMNIFNGGAHGNWVTDIQEYMIIPIGFDRFKEAMRASSEIYLSLKEILKEKKYATGVGDEGGFSPSVVSNIEPFILIIRAIEKAGYILGKDIGIGIDVAASELYKDALYNFKKDYKKMPSLELLAFYKSLVKECGVISIEDPFSEDDWSSFNKITSDLGDKIQIVGDDLYATNIARIQKGLNEKATNAVLIKLNQIGTLSETLEAILLAKNNGQKIIISHRSGDTEDTFIADLAVAVSADQIKSGAPIRSERVAKYNRLLEIEQGF